MKLKIGAAAKALGISPKTIRFYEDIGLIPPSRREGSGWFGAGQRVYEESELERLEFVKEARQLDFAIEDIRQLLATYESGPPCGCGARPFLKMLVERKLGQIAQTIGELEALRDEMLSLHARTVALENKTPADFMKSGHPKLSDAVFGRADQSGSEKGRPKHGK